MTPGFRLPAKWVIHTVGPVWRTGRDGEPELLGRCYRRSFELALDHKAESIAFPCISTGVYGYPPDGAAKIAVTVMREYSERMTRIIACCFSQGDAELYTSELTHRA